MSFSAEAVCHIVTPVSNLGYGFDNIGVQNILRHLAASTTPTALVLNSSLDGVGSGAESSRGFPAGQRASYLRDVRKLLRCVSSHGVPLILNMVMRRGQDSRLDAVAEMVDEAARERSLNIKVVTMDSIQSSASTPVGIGPSCAGPSRLERSVSPRTIGGVIQTFLEKAEETSDFDVLLMSSNSSLVPFMAYTSLCLKNAAQISSAQHLIPSAIMKGGVLHVSRILEEGGVCATPKCAGAVGKLFNDGSFEISPVGPKSQCSSISVASYMLQSTSRLSIQEVGGTLDLAQVSYQQLQDDRTVRVRGSLLRRVSDSASRSETHFQRPYRSVYLGRIIDVSLTTSIDESLQRVKGYVQAQQPHFPIDSWDLRFHVYGQNTPEAIVTGEITATTRDIARAITELARMATQLGFGLQNQGAQFPDSQVSVSDTASS